VLIQAEFIREDLARLIAREAVVLSTRFNALGLSCARVPARFWGVKAACAECTARLAVALTSDKYKDIAENPLTPDADATDFWTLEHTWESSRSVALDDGDIQTKTFSHLS